MTAPGRTAARERRRNKLGVWSVALGLAFLILFALWLAYVRATPIPRPTFFSDPLHASLILSAAAAAVAGGVSGAIAIILKRERSVGVLLSVLLGAFVFYWALMELNGH